MYIYIYIYIYIACNILFGFISYDFIEYNFDYIFIYILSFIASVNVNSKCDKGFCFSFSRIYSYKQVNVEISGNFRFVTPRTSRFLLLKYKM